MLRAWLVATCSLGAVFSGCVGLFDAEDTLCGDGPGAIDDEQAVRAAFEEAARFLDPMTAPAFHIDQSVTTHYDKLQMRWSFDGANAALAVDAEDDRTRLQGAWWSTEGGSERGHGRDHRPGGAMADMVEGLDAMMFGFAVIEGGYSHEAACTTFDGREAVIFEREWLGADMTMTVDAEAPHLPRQATMVRHAPSYMEMVSTVEYGSVEVTVDRSLPRVPATTGFEMAYGDDQDVIHLTGTTQWVPLSEVRVDVLDDAGAVSSSATLDDLATTKDGAVRFVDADGNGYMSGGDILSVPAGAPWSLYDLWADAPVELQDETFDGPFETSGSKRSAERVKVPGLIVKSVVGTREPGTDALRWLNITVSGGSRDEDVDLTTLLLRTETGTELMTYRFSEGPGKDGFEVEAVRDTDASLDRHRLGWDDYANIGFDLREARLGPREEIVIHLVPDIGDAVALRIQTPAHYGSDTFIILR